MKSRSQTGQAIVEFAFVLPILLLMILGIIEFSLLLYDKAVITNASREGARVGIVAQDRSNISAINTTISDAVNNYCRNNVISFGSTTVTIPAPAWSGYTFGDSLTVTVNFNYTWLVLPHFISGFGSAKQITASTKMRLE